MSPELVTFLSLKNSPISSNHQNVHQNWWKFNRKFKSPKHSPKLVKILAKIHWKMNVVSYLWDHIDFLQNCHQFWWFPWIFANFGDFFAEIFSDSLKFSPKLVTKKNKIGRNYFHQNWWYFCHLKLTNFIKSPKFSPKLMKIQ